MDRKEFPEQNEIVLCIVDRIFGTTVFVKMLKYRNKEGVVATSEVAPGRIRNIRDYVNVGKKIVCKVLRVDEKTGNMDLSLRRVSKKEREDAITADGKDRDAFAMLNIVAKENAEEIARKIAEEYSSLAEFIQKIDSADSEKFGLSKESKAELVRIIGEKPKKVVSIKSGILLKSEESDGVIKIKEIFSEVSKSRKDVKFSYISAPNYSVTMTGNDYKDANKKLQEILKRIEELAGEKHCKAEIPE